MSTLICNFDTASLSVLVAQRRENNIAFNESCLETELTQQHNAG